MPKNMSLEYVPCDFCGGNNFKVIFHQKDKYIKDDFMSSYPFRICKCTDCGLIFVNPRPTREAMSLFYPSDYHAQRTLELMQKRYARQKPFLPEFKVGTKILDVGCAKGDFLHWLKKETTVSFDAFGCDAYSTSIREAYDIYFKSKELIDCDYQENFFDCVMAWAVLEHVHSPDLYFKEIAKVIKRNGTLVFLVPNFNSLQCRLMKHDDVARHIYQFTSKAINNYMQRYGFEYQIYYDDSIFDGRCLAMFEELLKKKGKFGKLIWRLFNYFKLWSSWETKLKCSGVVVVVAKKV